MKKKTNKKAEAQKLLDKYYDRCGLHNEGPIVTVKGMTVYNDGYSVMVIESGKIIVKKELEY